MSPPLERTRARLFSRSMSSTFSDRTSCARAAVSYSSRHSAFSRTATSSRRQSRSSWAYGIAFVRSTGSRRRSSPSAIGASSQPRRRQKPENDRSVATWRFHVAGAVWPHASRATRSSSRAPSRSIGRSAPSACCRRAERLGVGAAAGVGEVGLGEERVDRVGQRRDRVARRPQPPNRPLAARSSQGMRRFDRRRRATRSPTAAGAGSRDVAGNGPFPATPYEPAPDALGSGLKPDEVGVAERPAQD